MVIRDGRGGARRGHDDGTEADFAPVPAWARTVVRVMDEAFTIPGTDIRIGLDGILGMIFPGAGDTVTATTGILLIVYAIKAGVPGVVIFRMAMNVAIDSAIGAIPIFGDLFDFAWRSNRKNLDLIERFQRPGEKPSGSEYALVLMSILVVLICLAIPVALMIAIVVKLLS